MNRRSPGFLLVSQAGEGFLQYKTAEGLSPRTISRYRDFLRIWLKHAGDVPLNQITTDSLRTFLIWLRTEYQPYRITGAERALSNKTVRNIYMFLSSFYTWAGRELNLPSPLKGVPAPKFEQVPVEPFTKEEITALLKACEFSRAARTTLRRSYTMQRVNVHRDQALILVLLDTGLRASELCALQIGHVDMQTGKVIVRPGREGGAKGGKGRTVFLGKTARRALWRYLVDRADGKETDAPLFTDRYDHPLNKNSLRLAIARLGKNAGVKHCHPHRFRHTFAITYLRSGGDVFTLQSLLGHSTLDMVQHYARIAEIDVEQAHKRASPADNWRL